LNDAGAVTKPRRKNPLKFAGVPQTRQQTVGGNFYVSKMVYLTVPNPGINPGIMGLAFLNPEIPELENGPGIAIPSCRVRITSDSLDGVMDLSNVFI